MRRRPPGLGAAMRDIEERRWGGWPDPGNWSTPGSPHGRPEHVAGGGPAPRQRGIPPQFTRWVVGVFHHRGAGPDDLTRV